MTFNKDLTCCFTGHRNIPSYLYNEVRAAVSYTAKRLIESGIDTFISGGAMGFDLIAAEAIIDLKSTFPHIRLIFAIPCPDHDAKWRYNDRIRYNVLSRYCDEVIVVSDSYYDGCMLTRNKYMVDNSAYCVSYCTRKVGGTAYTLRYAAACGVINTEISNMIR